MERYLRTAFFIFARALVLVLLGMNVRRRELLPAKGPAIIVANHNSHLDTLVLMSLFPLKALPQIHPVAAVDYFLRSRFMSWFSTNIIGIIPMDRTHVTKGNDPLKPVGAALERGNIVILFPEGTRGEPEQMAQFKKGIAHIAERYPRVPVVPVFMHGLGKALPRGDFVLVPFFCDVFVGESMLYSGSREDFMNMLNERFQSLASEGHFSTWE